MFGTAGPRCEHVFRELYENAPYMDLRFLRLKVVELLMLLSRIPQEEGTDLYCSTEQTELAHHLRDHLLTNREGYVSLAQLAEEHGISVSHLQKMFKQVYGVPVYHYIKEYRLEQAAVELVRSAKPITQIAQNAGYDNASKFRRLSGNDMDDPVAVPHPRKWTRKTEQENQNGVVHGRKIC
mgnify:CR=1 FL=1